MNRIKRFIFRGSVRGLAYYPQVTLPTVTLGSEYGRWTVCSANLRPESVVFSVGVGEDISADAALIEKFGVKVYAFDPTPSSVNWVKQNRLPKRFFFNEVGIAAYDGTASFFLPKSEEYVSHSLVRTDVTGEATIQVPVKRVATLMEQYNIPEIDLLKLDIEGAEYDVIRDIVSSKTKINQLVIEFHHKFANVGLEKTKDAVNLLLKNGYKIFYISEDTRDWGFIKLPAENAKR